MPWMYTEAMYTESIEMVVFNKANTAANAAAVATAAVAAAAAAANITERTSSSVRFSKQKKNTLITAVNVYRSHRNGGF